MKEKSLVDVFLKRGRSDKGITFIPFGGKDHFLSYSLLYRASINVLGYLQNLGFRKGQELVFQIEDNQSFLTVFWACILGGIRPVPLTVGSKETQLVKVFKVWKVLERPALIASSAHLEKLRAFAQLKSFKDEFSTMEDSLVLLGTALQKKEQGKIEEAKPDDIAFIQFSSGSTGAPKGVVLTHRNLLVNTRDIASAANYTEKDSLLSWMPLTHDMGLIGFHINPLCVRSTSLFDSYTPFC